MGKFVIRGFHVSNHLMDFTLNVGENRLCFFSSHFSHKFSLPKKRKPLRDRELLHRHILLMETETGREVDDSETKHRIFESSGLRYLLFIDLPFLLRRQDFRVVLNGLIHQLIYIQPWFFRLSY